MKKYIPLLVIIIFIFGGLKLMLYNSEKEIDKGRAKHKIVEEELKEKLKYDVYYDRIEKIISEGVNDCNVSYKEFVYESEDELVKALENKKIYKIEMALYNYERNVTDDTRRVKEQYKSLEMDEKKKELIDIEEAKFFKELEIETEKIKKEYFNTSFSEALANIYRIEKTMRRGINYCVMAKARKNGGFLKDETEDGRKIEYFNNIGND